MSASWWRPRLKYFWLLRGQNPQVVLRLFLCHSTPFPWTDEEKRERCKKGRCVFVYASFSRWRERLVLPVFFVLFCFFFVFLFRAHNISKCCRTHTKKSSYDIIFHWIFFHKQLPRLKHSNFYFLRACVPWVVISHPVGKTEKFCNFSFLWKSDAIAGFWLISFSFGSAQPKCFRQFTSCYSKASLRFHYSLVAE